MANNGDMEDSPVCSFLFKTAVTLCTNYTAQRTPENQISQKLHITSETQTFFCAQHKNNVV